MLEMTHDQRIKTLLLDALECAPAERAAFLLRATPDQDARREVQALLDAHEQAGEFMAEAAVTPADDHTISASALEDDLVGSMVGRYRLMRVIGEGGFGRVYHAEQREPMRREVAVKIIKGGMDTRQVIGRFEAERQALAMMDHPGIARVLDAGADPRGRPYFVMELVHGSPITAYCDEQRLDITSRLDLFVRVCAAVQHAHSKGVIHRDIKPGNILVERGEAPCPKVIDFGVAKAISGRLTDGTLLTEQRQLIGTPQYMSPEQADLLAADVDTRSDVYALGVVLYELLTGTTPLDAERLRAASYGDLQRMIREEDPPTPSTRLSSLNTLADIATHRAIEPRRLVSQLRGDLDWIAIKAMEKDREQRYGSPAELAADIRRHLAHEPVVAGPRRVGYRFRKFARRHRTGMIIAALASTFALAGGSVVVASMLHARDATDQSEQVNRFMADMLTRVDPDRGNGADVRLIEVLGQASAAASQWFADNPQVEAEVREVIGRTYSKLALFELSVAEYRQSLALSRDSLGANHPATLRRQVGLASGLANSGRSDQMLQMVEGLPERLDAALGPRHGLWFVVRTMQTLQLSRRGEYTQAVESLQTLMQQAARANVAEDVQIGILRSLVRATWRQLVNTVGPERAALGEQLARRTDELARRSAADSGPESVLALQDQALMAQTLYGVGRIQEAADLAGDLLERCSERLGQCHTVMENARDILARALVRLDRVEEATDLVLLSVECDRDTAPVTYVSQLYDSLPLLDRGGRWADGERIARELTQRLKDIGGGHGAMVLDSETAVARFVSLQGRLEEADAMFLDLLAREHQAPKDRHTRARLQVAYGAHLVKLGRFEQAEHHMQAAAEILGDVRLGTWNHMPDDVIIQFIALYQAWDKPDKVDEYRALQREAIAMREAGFGPE